MNDVHERNGGGAGPGGISPGRAQALREPPTPPGARELPKPRAAHHAEETKRSLVARLRRIEGQVRGIAGMIERDVYCDDVLHQIAAVEAALGGVRLLLLEAHIRGCVVEQVLEGRGEVIDELMTTIGKMSR